MLMSASFTSDVASIFCHESFTVTLKCGMIRIKETKNPFKPVIVLPHNGIFKSEGLWEMWACLSLASSPYIPSHCTGTSASAVHAPGKLSLLVELLWFCVSWVDWKH